MSLDQSDRPPNHSPTFRPHQTGYSHAYPTGVPRRAAPERAARPPSSSPVPQAAQRTDARLGMLMSALASAAAGIVHAAAAPAHWAEFPAAGGFFVLMALFQLCWAVLILPFENRFLMAVGILANLGFIGLWVVSRWHGLPIGPHAGTPEAVGLADALTTVLEAWIVVNLVWALLPRVRHGVLSPGGYRFAAVTATIVLGIAVIPGVGSALSHGGEGHQHGGAEETDHHGGTGGEDHHGGAEDGGHHDADTPDESPGDSSGQEDHTHGPGEEHD